MKAIVVAAVSLALLVATVIYEESRISKLEDEIAELKKPATKSPARLAGSRPAGSPRRGAPGGPAATKGDRAGSRAAAVADAPGAGEESEENWAETFRRMADNPVGAAMMKEANKGRALRMYGGFIDTLNLDQDEKEYFLGLVAGGVGVEDRVGMELFAAKSDEERVAILDKMEADEAARREAVREFLNDDDDFARYEQFEDRKEIYEQLPGLRAAMEATGAPLQPAQEERIVNAIFEASVQSGLRDDWDGRAGMEQFGAPGATERFKAQWATTQEILNQNAGAILDSPAQQEALREHQTQVGNMVIFGLQFVEGMMEGQRPGGGGE